MNENSEREARRAEAADGDGQRVRRASRRRAEIRLILTFQATGTEDELRILPVWKPHQLAGDRKGIWALHVTQNWRITFEIDGDAIEIIDLNFEDYH